ncbi:MAG: response regulator [Burkholderiaceae bacterium]|nr:response regulator [Burkholderiaceae bacterium]
MSSALAPAAQRVALLGFGDFERSALVSYIRLSGSRVPAYAEAVSLADADYLIADADHAGTLDAVLGAERVADTVFIGSLAPDGALAWMMRPIDPLQVFREIDATVALRRAQAQAAPSAGSPPPTLSDEVTQAPAPPQRPAARAPADRGTARRAGDVSAPVEALLVDDSEIALRFLERQLQDLGLRTETASHSQRALELLAQRRFDVIFLDVDLGPHSELDGLALCQRIKQQHRLPAAAEAPVVVMVSAHAASTDRVRGSFAGCDAYLGKPLDDDALRRSLRTLGLRLSAPADAGNSRPGALSSRPAPLDRSR